MGVVFAVASLTEVIIYPFSAKIKKLIGGNFPCFIAAVFSYCLRFLLFSFTKNYLLLLPMQLLHLIGYALFWSKGRISKLVLQENKTRQIFRKENISYPLIRTRVCVSRGKKCSFFEKFGVFCFLVTAILRFGLLPYYRQIVKRSRFLMVKKAKHDLHSKDFIDL